MRQRLTPRMFYRKDLGTFLSMRPDLSDLADEYLVVAIDNLRAMNRPIPPEAEARILGRKAPQLGANRDTD